MIDYYDILKAYKTGDTSDPYSYLYGKKLSKVRGLLTTTLEGYTPLTLKNAVEKPADWTIYGKSWQDGTPTPENPVEIQSVGSSGAYVKHGKNLIDETKLKKGFVADSNGRIADTDENDVVYSDLIEINNATCALSIVGTRANIPKYEHYLWYAFLYYDSDKNPVGNRSNNHLTNIVDNFNYHAILKPYVSDAKYIKISYRRYGDVKIQLEQGDTATEYEPYWEKTVYPVEIKTCGKNLIDDTLFYQNTLSKIPNATETTIEGKVGVQFSSSKANHVYVYEFEPMPNINYTFSCDVKRVTYKGRGFYIRIYDENSVMLFQANIEDSLPDSKLKLSFSTTISKIYFGFSYGASDTWWVDKYSIQLELGSEATEYEPYKEITQTLELDQPLRGIQVTDSSLATYTDEDGKMWCADSVDSNGEVVRRISEKEVTSNLRFSMAGVGTSGERFGVSRFANDILSSNNAYSTHYVKGTMNSNNRFNVYSSEYLDIKDNSVSSVDDYKQFLDKQKESNTPVSIDYIINPSTSQLTTKQLPLFKGTNNIIVTDDAYTEIKYKKKR